MEVISDKDLIESQKKIIENLKSEVAFADRVFNNLRLLINSKSNHTQEFATAKMLIDDYYNGKST